MAGHAPAPTGKNDAAMVSDFELVRNAAGEWLLIVPGLPERLFDNPLEPIAARLDDEHIIIENSAARVVIGSLLASHYAQALRKDNPGHMLLCSVNDDGIRQLGTRIVFEIV